MTAQITGAVLCCSVGVTTYSFFQGLFPSSLLWQNVLALQNTIFGLNVHDQCSNWSISSNTENPIQAHKLPTEQQKCFLQIHFHLQGPCQRNLEYCFWFLDRTQRDLPIKPAEKTGTELQSPKMKSRIVTDSIGATYSRVEVFGLALLTSVLVLASSNGILKTGQVEYW